MVDSYHPFWWWCGCITYLLLRECLLHTSFSVKMLHRHVAYLRTSSVKRGGKPNCFLKRSCSLAHGLCLKSNTSFTLAFSFLVYFLGLFCCISESFGLGWPDLLLWIWKCCLFNITAKHKLLCHKKKGGTEEYVCQCRSLQRFRSTTSNRFTTWVMCGLQPDVRESYLP